MGTGLLSAPLPMEAAHPQLGQLTRASHCPRQGLKAPHSSTPAQETARGLPSHCATCCSLFSSPTAGRVKPKGSVNHWWSSLFTGSSSSYVTQGAALVQLCWEKPRCLCLSTLPRQILGGAQPLQPHPLGSSRWLTRKPGREAGEVINLPGHLTDCSSLFAFFVCLPDASFLMFELKELLEKSHPSQGAADQHKQNSHCWQWKAFSEVNVFSSLESSLLVPAHALRQPALIYSTMLYGEIILGTNGWLKSFYPVSHMNTGMLRVPGQTPAVRARLRTILRSMLELEKGWVVPFAGRSQKDTVSAHAPGCRTVLHDTKFANECQLMPKSLTSRLLSNIKLIRIGI